MVKSKSADIAGTILLVAGLLLAFLPHAAHASIGLEESSHLIHVLAGLVIAIIGILTLTVSNRQ